LREGCGSGSSDSVHLAEEYVKVKHIEVARRVVEMLIEQW
jgi:acetylornithine deacetylase/succinyl-diaminopimelate desuccinylase-like protein